MKILIVGGLSYLGGRIVKHIKAYHPDVELLITTRNPHKRLPLWAKDFVLLPLDLLDEDSISACLVSRGIDVIIHLAALQEADSMKDPEMALDVNVKGTYKLLNHARRNDVKRFIYISTIHVYGNVNGSVITEETPTRPHHPYAATHRAAEDVVDFFHKYHNVETLILRLSNGYGYPADRDIARWNLVFNDLCRQVVTTGKIVLKSSGKQYRNFVPIYDIARAICHFLYFFTEPWGGGLYNLGGESPIMILDVAQKIAEVYKRKYNKDMVEIVTEPDVSKIPIPMPAKYCIDKIKQTGFVFKGDMVQEIENTMELCDGFVEKSDSTCHEVSLGKN